MHQINEQQDNLLILDDEKEILSSIYRQFRKKYNVFLANSAEEAAKIMHKNSIQVIISDQRMPGMSGTEFLKQIKKEFPDVVSLILSGYSDIRSLEEALEIGNVHKFIQKPWIPVELETIVNEAFDKHKLIVENKRLLKSLIEANAGLEAKVEERTKELEDTITKLKTAKEKAEESDRLKSTFLANLSHEIRTPLNKILGFSELLVNKEDINTKEKFFNIIRQSGYELLYCIENIIDSSKLETNQINIVREVCFIDDLLKVVEIEILKIQTRNNKKNINIIIQNDLAENEKIILVDDYYLKKALIHIFDNALKFTKRGYIKLNCYLKDKKEVIFSAEDTGIGIPKEKQKLIFDLFRQSEESSDRSYGGNGLGLSITKKIVELLDGNIWLQSEKDRGTTFYISIPYIVPNKTPY